MDIQELLKKPMADLTDNEVQAVIDFKKKAQKDKETQDRAEYEKEKNDFVTELAYAFKIQAEKLKEIKTNAIAKANEFQNRMYEINGKEAKEQKSFQIKDKNDNYKVIIDRQERFEFTEEATVHINSIKEIFKEKFEQRNKGFYNLLDSILMRNGKGDYDPKLLAKARMEVKKLGDQNLIDEFEKLSDCLRVVGSATYIRVYVKDENKKWKDISLNFSSI